VIKVELQRHIDEQCSEEVRYYIASFSADAARSHAAVRNHWAIENGLHWVLDMSFGEDQSRIRKGHAVANMAVIRHTVINALNSIKEKGQSIKMLRKKASWRTDALAKNNRCYRLDEVALRSSSRRSIGRPAGTLGLRRRFPKTRTPSKLCPQAYVCCTSRVDPVNHHNGSFRTTGDGRNTDNQSFSGVEG
jgi:predicted transposase YbfD/YdcC